MKVLANHKNGTLLSQPTIVNNLLSLVDQSSRFALYVTFGRKGKPWLSMFDLNSQSDLLIRSGRELDSFLRDVCQVDFKRGAGAVSMANVFDALKRHEPIWESGNDVASRIGKRLRKKNTIDF